MPTITDVQDIAPVIRYTGINGQTSYVYPFPIFDERDIFVVIDTVDLVLNVDFSVTGVTQDNGGTIELFVPTTGGEQIVIYRETIIDRLTDYISGGDFTADAVNNDFDRIILMLQELRSGVSGLTRAYRVGADDNTPSADMVVPNRLVRNESVFTFDATAAASVVPFDDFPGLIGLAAYIDGTGLSFDPTGNPDEFTINVNAGFGLQSNADDIQITAANLLILSNADIGNIGKISPTIFTGDADQLITAGFWEVSAVTLNLPVPAPGTIIVAAGGVAKTTQIYTSSLTANTYIRTKIAGTWQIWTVNMTLQNHDSLVQVDAIEVNFNDAPFNFYTELQTAQAASLTAAGTRFDDIPVSFVALEVQTAIEQLDIKIGAIVGGLNFRGTWDALTNTPDIANDPLLASGDFWKVSVAGASPLPAFQTGVPLVAWIIGDTALYGDDTVDTGWFDVPQQNVVLATEVVFNPANYELVFPAPGPATSQQAFDVSWPTLANAEFSNVGKDTVAAIATDLDLEVRSGFYPTAAAAPNAPLAENGALIVSASTLNDTAQIWTSLASNQTYTRVQTAGAWTPWLAPGVPATRQIIAGTGCVGGGNFTADRTIDVVGGAGMVANADSMDIGPGVGVLVNADNIQLDQAAPENVDHGLVNVIAGDCMIGGGPITADVTMNVVASTGLTASPDDIFLNWASPTERGGIEIEVTGVGPDFICNIRTV